MKTGIWLGLAAYGLWGLLPVYWKSLHTVPAAQLLSHRIVWSCLMLVGVLLVTRRWAVFRAAALNRQTVRLYLLAAALIGLNWLTYVWAVNAGFIVETSLGYFINPLLSVVLGVVFLRERLRLGQWFPIGLAAAGVVYLTMRYGALPWIALTLAFSFGFYGLVKKLAPLNSLFGLTLETGLLFAPALMYLVTMEARSQAAFGHAGLGTTLLLIGAGAVTTIPLLLFAAAAHRIPLSLVGLLQYIAPTSQFLIGVFIYHEPFTAAQVVGFGLVWVALALFAAEGFWAMRSTPTKVGP
jgi:chloramphenicol-sensitive protein RarD